MTDRFELLEELGAGGMGAVWKARDTETGELVALKLVHSHLARDPDYVARFEREVEIARRVDSPHVVRVLGYGTRDGIPFMVMEYVEGQSLRELLSERGKLTWDEAKPIVRQVAEGLGAAHTAGIVHRDVKPSNIIVTPDGTAKLADFGIARALDMTRLTGASTLVGTPHYMAPEGSGTPQADFYALGCVLYELLTGSTVYGDGEPQEIIRRHIEGTPDLATLPPGQPRALTGWLLAKDPRRRPGSALELEAAITGTTPIPSARRRPARLPALVAAGSALAIVAVAATAGVAYFGSGEAGGGPGNPTATPNTGVVATAEVGAAPPQHYVEFILDASGSMQELIDGQPKLVIAKDVLLDQMVEIRRDARAGLRVYGSEPFVDADQSCKDSRLVVPITSEGRASIEAALAPVMANGNTPIAHSLELAAADFTFEPGRTNVVVLISDGEETCAGDPADAVAALQARGIRFSVHVIGLLADSQTRAQLQRIADVAGGKSTYHDANSAEDLRAALARIQGIELGASPTPTPTLTSTPTLTAVSPVPSRTATTTGGPTVTLAPPTTVPTPVPPVLTSLSCSPATVVPWQSITCWPTTYGQVTSYAWSAPGGSPPGGTGVSFTTSFSSAGQATIWLEVCNGSRCVALPTAVTVTEPMPTTPPAAPAWASYTEIYCIVGPCPSNLNWADTENEDGYNIYWDQGVECPGGWYTSVGANVTYLDLEYYPVSFCGASLTYGVSAFNEYGESPIMWSPPP